MSAHSPCPWFTGSKYYPSDIYASGGGNPVARCTLPKFKGQCEIDAKRIVTCVNALDGLNQDALDGGWNFKDHGRAARQMELQRDELLVLLKDLVDLEGPQPGNSAWGDRALALIAKIEGGAA